MAHKLDATVLAARRAGVPLLAVSTADQWALQTSLFALFPDAPVLTWDCVRGPVGLNDLGKAQVTGLGAEREKQCRGFVPMMVHALGFERLTVVLAHNAHAQLKTPEAIQALSNLRDLFKGCKRTLVLMGPAFDALPPELQPDVIVLEDPLPTDEAMTAIVNEIHDAYGVNQPKGDELRRALDAGRGLSAFTAEQVYAMSIEKTGLDLDRAWERKAAMVKQTPGLTKFVRGGPTFDALGGLDAAKRMAAQLFAGPAAPQLIVRVEEIEKTWAGALNGGETSGSSAYAMGRVLTAMEDEGWDGMIGLGLGGSGKSAYANALAATFGRPRIDLDLGATKSKWVGESEAGVNNMIRVLRHIGGARVFFVATCNRIEALPPELLRRFRTQPWYFDVPTPEERLAIWPVHLSTYGLKVTAEQADREANATNWTGAEIRNCCESAWKFGISVKDAARDYVVPVARSRPEDLKRLRDLAKDRFLSATYPGAYRDPAQQQAAAPSRRREIGG